MRNKAKYILFYNRFLTNVEDNEAKGHIFFSLFNGLQVPENTNILPVKKSDVIYSENILKYYHYINMLGQNIGFELLRHYCIDSKYKEYVDGQVIDTFPDIKEEVNTKGVELFKVKDDVLNHDINRLIIKKINIEENYISYVFNKRAESTDIRKLLLCFRKQLIYFLPLKAEYDNKEQLIINVELKNKSYILNKIKSIPTDNIFNTGLLLMNKIFNYQFTYKALIKHANKENIMGSVSRLNIIFGNDHNMKNQLLKFAYYSLYLPDDDIPVDSETIHLIEKYNLL